MFPALSAGYSPNFSLLKMILSLRALPLEAKAIAVLQFEAVLKLCRPSKFTGKRVFKS
jgi:hypothetical protein